MSKVSQLVERLEAMGFLDVEAGMFQRIYSSVPQRQSGAWSWFIPNVRHPDYGGGQIVLDVGSHFSVTGLLKADEWTHGRDVGSQDVSIDPSS